MLKYESRKFMVTNVNIIWGENDDLDITIIEATDIDDPPTGVKHELIIDYFRPFFYLRDVPKTSDWVNSSGLKYTKTKNDVSVPYFKVRCNNYNSYVQISKHIEEERVHRILTRINYPYSFYLLPPYEQLIIESGYKLKYKGEIEIRVAPLPDSETGVKRWNVSRISTGQNISKKK